MNLPSLIVLLIVLAALFFALRAFLRSPGKGGCNCAGGCNGCAGSGSCPHCHEE